MRIPGLYLEKSRNGLLTNPYLLTIIIPPSHSVICNLQCWNSFV